MSAGRFKSLGFVIGVRYLYPGVLGETACIAESLFKVSVPIYPLSVQKANISVCRFAFKRVIVTTT
jgi:hypothetical protein